MGRARRARKIAATAAYGGGGLAAASAALGAIGYAVVRAEAAIARRVVGTPLEDAPDDDGSYGHGPGEVVRIVVLGDSTAAGLGANDRTQTIGAIIAAGVSALRGRRVELINRAVVGAESSDLDRQFSQALGLDADDHGHDHEAGHNPEASLGHDGGQDAPHPDLVLIMIGANDVTHRTDRASAVRHLEAVVRRARGLGAEVVVGTCPDLGTVEPVPQPLRLLMRRWSRDLAAAQTVAVVEAGGRTVSLGDLLGPEFSASPQEMFATDRFHPSPAGYARAAAALLPSVCAALGVWGGDSGERAPETRRGEGVGPVAVAAGQAVLAAGTEVSPTEVGGQARGPRGRWAALRRRRQPPTTLTSAAVDTASVDPQDASSITPSATGISPEAAERVSDTADDRG